MTDYIKRKNAKRAVCGCIRDTGIDEAPFEYAEGLLEDVPAEDVEPVQHGHWIKITPSGVYECSKCGKYVMTCDIEEYKYCHRCGARMDGDNNAFI